MKQLLPMPDEIVTRDDLMDTLRALHDSFACVSYYGDGGSDTVLAFLAENGVRLGEGAALSGTEAEAHDQHVEIIQTAMLMGYFLGAAAFDIDCPEFGLPGSTVYLARTDVLRHQEGGEG